jgi:hypothetical protein
MQAERLLTGPESPPGDRRSIAVSVAVHGVLLILLLLLTRYPRTQVRPTEESIAVQIVPSAPPQAARPAPAILTAPKASATAAAPPAPPASDKSTHMLQGLAPPTSDGMVQAKTFFAANTLADPRSAKAVAELNGVALDDRKEQICDLEAMEQVEAWKKSLKTEQVIAYALKDAETDGATIHAEGAAIRANGLWYKLRFDCTLGADDRTVTAFAFKLGDAIPKSDWERYYLPAGGDED